jgi:hypothetical protein
MKVGERSRQPLGLAWLWKLNTASTKVGSSVVPTAASGLLPRAAARSVIQALFFGYFLLGQQKKVTRRPAGTGGLPPRHPNGGLLQANPT